MNHQTDVPASDMEPAPSTPVMRVVDGKAFIQLNRPRQHNRLEQPDIAALMEYFDQIERDGDIRVLILSATGQSFSSGYSLDTLAAGRGNEGSLVGELEQLCNRLENLRVPSICACNGNVYGGATDLAISCDFRIGVEGMQMVMPASRLGLHYYYGGLRRYVERLGLSAAKWLFLTGELVDTATLHRIGFLHEVVLPGVLSARAGQLATILAERAPRAVQGMKASLNEIAKGGADEAIIEQRFLQSMKSNDLAEGLRAWTEKRKPIFTGD